ncbi:hypothetical protein ASG87_06835 [Frateuria sp. Soil773]|uniref:DUF3348 domain-containing protein n=1 Tax=Frateuria sp. Soil773 TaxID=1736407 RepID=UPI0006F3E8C1|nr:DUF3348 domain-containing protein [Frateuria sp. Soil773]KRE88327.1 hypothetical protein ASG87_06835 [Frateuria sp. Soil773]
MVQAPRPTLEGPSFIRLLARLAGAGIPQSGPPLSDRLSQWLDWNRAIALSTALDAGLPAADDPGVPAAAGAEEEECARVRASLAQAIAGDPGSPPARQQAGGASGGEDGEADYAAFRERYLAMQRAMLTATGRLRGRLRDRLAAEPGEMARLAAVDAAMEQALSPREQTLLAAMPVLLGGHFERLRQAAREAPAGSAPGAWLEAFRKDLRDALLAELDVRFQPVEGLLAALRTRQPRSDVEESA